MVTSKSITVGAARQVLDRLVAEGGDPARIVEAEDLAAFGGDAADTLAPIVAAAIEANPEAAERILAGNPKAIGPIVGYVMRETRGRADGAEVNRLVQEQLGV
jgi:aspartyl-tRNA(Asn)/glutamyl-tRNA(Gln) amidotransferase subunit B